GARACRSSGSRSSGSRTAVEGRSPGSPPWETSARVATSVAVSKARINIAPPRATSAAVVAMVERDLDARRRQDSRARLRPFDEHDRVVEIRLQVAPLRRGDVAEAEEIEMGHVDATPIAVADREGRARDGPLHAECAARPAYEGRLAGAELAGD